MSEDIEQLKRRADAAEALCAQMREAGETLYESRFSHGLSQREAEENWKRALAKTPADMGVVYTEAALKKAWSTPAGLRAHVLRYGPEGYDISSPEDRAELERLRTERDEAALELVSSQSSRQRADDDVTALLARVAALEAENKRLTALGETETTVTPGFWGKAAARLHQELDAEIASKTAWAVRAQEAEERIERLVAAAAYPVSSLRAMVERRTFPYDPDADRAALAAWDAAVEEVKPKST
jgi:hypothetical protein